MQVCKNLPSTPVTRLHIMAAVACAFALAIDMIEIAIGNVLATVFSAPPHAVSSSELSWMLSSVFLGAVLEAPLLGWISDRRGIRSCLAAALAWLALTSFMAGASTTVWKLSVFRFLSGVSLGAISPLLIAYLTRIAPARYRGAFIFWVLRKRGAHSACGTVDDSGGDRATTLRGGRLALAPVRSRRTVTRCRWRVLVPATVAGTG